MSKLLIPKELTKQICELADYNSQLILLICKAVEYELENKNPELNNPTLEDIKELCEKSLKILEAVSINDWLFIYQYHKEEIKEMESVDNYSYQQVVEYDSCKI